MTRAERNSRIVQRMRNLTDKFDARLKHSYDEYSARCNKTQLENLMPFEEELNEIYVIAIVSFITLLIFVPLLFV